VLVFLAFAVREQPLPGGLGAVGQIGLIGGSLALGTFLATATGTKLRIRRPARLQAIGLSLVAVVALWATLRFTLSSVLLLCLVTAVASGWPSSPSTRRSRSGSPRPYGPAPSPTPRRC
jgi:hypothetical protein